MPRVGSQESLFFGEMCSDFAGGRSVSFGSSSTADLLTGHAWDRGGGAHTDQPRRRETVVAHLPGVAVRTSLEIGRK
jgi:hypothetical protein